MTEMHYVAMAVGAAVGSLVVYVLIRFVRRERPSLVDIDNSREVAVPSHEQLAEAAKALPGKPNNSFADVKDTF